jgi:hypothetical protein
MPTILETAGNFYFNFSSVFLFVSLTVMNFLYFLSLFCAKQFFWEMTIANAVRKRIKSLYSVIFFSASGMTMTPLVYLMTMPSYARF